MVDVEKGHGGPTGLRAAKKDGTVPLEVAFPELTSRMEEQDNLAGERIAGAEVRSLLEIAPMAAPAPIVGGIDAAMLASDDVLDVKTGRGSGGIRQVTVFAPLTGPLAYPSAQGPSHRTSEDRFSKARALAWRIAMK